MEANLKHHWENIYKTKQPHEVSWTETVPRVSLEFIHKFNVSGNAKIIDVGGGDSKLVDNLLQEGFTDITVLDISEAAIERAKMRLGKNSSRVKWIVKDILDFRPEENYKVWHDRAAFHFQTNPENIERYLNVVKAAKADHLIVGTFSTEGPLKCSGLEIKQYDEAGMKARFEARSYKNIECKREDHVTPAGAVQNFVFCSFEKK